MSPPRAQTPARARRNASASGWRAPASSCRQLPGDGPAGLAGRPRRRGRRAGPHAGRWPCSRPPWPGWGSSSWTGWCRPPGAARRATCQPGALAGGGRGRPAGRADGRHAAPGAGARAHPRRARATWSTSGSWRRRCRLELRHFEDSEVYDKMQNARREASSRPLSLALQALAVGQNLVTLAALSGLLAAALPLERAGDRGRLRPRLPRRGAALGRVLPRPHLAGPGGPAAQLPGVDPDPRQPRQGGEAVRAGAAGPGPLPPALPALLRRGPAAGPAPAPGRRWLYGLLSLAAFYAMYAAHGLAGRRRRPSAWATSTLYIVVFRQGQAAVQAVLQAVGGVYEDALFMSNLFAYLEIPTGGEAPRRRPGAARRRDGPQRLRAAQRLLPLPGPGGLGAARA